MRIRKQFNNLKAGAKKVLIGLMVVSLLSTASGIGTIMTYATVDEELALPSDPTQNNNSETPNNTEETTPTPDPDGGTPAQNPDGSTPASDSDGSTPASNPDGTTPTQNPDGTTPTQDPDGTTPAQNPDGTTPTQNPDGTTPTQNPDGTTPTQNPDGTTPAQNPDGTTPSQNPDGTTPSQNPDGTTPAQNPDGTTPAQNPDETTPAQNPDGTQKGTATEEGSSGEHVHEVDFNSNGNGTHSGTCKTCGQEVTESCNTDGEDGKCSKCGYKYQPADHTHDVDFTSNGNGTHSGVCRICGETITETCNTFGANGACSVCSTKTENTTICDHDVEFTSNKDGTHSGICKKCGETIKEQCDTKGEGGICSVCGYDPVNNHAHEYTYKDNGDGTHTATCACGDTKISAHNFEWVCTDEEHKYVCKDCGYEDTSKAGEHVFYDALGMETDKCVICEYTRVNNRKMMLRNIKAVAINSEADFLKYFYTFNVSDQQKYTGEDIDLCTAVFNGKDVLEYAGAKYTVNSEPEFAYAYTDPRGNVGVVTKGRNIGAYIATAAMTLKREMLGVTDIITVKYENIGTSVIVPVDMATDTDVTTVPAGSIDDLSVMNYSGNFKDYYKVYYRGFELNKNVTVVPELVEVDGSYYAETGKQYSIAFSTNDENITGTLTRSVVTPSVSIMYNGFPYSNYSFTSEGVSLSCPGYEVSLNPNGTFTDSVTFNTVGFDGKIYLFMRKKLGSGYGAVMVGTTERIAISSTTAAFKFDDFFKQPMEPNGTLSGDTYELVYNGQYQNFFKSLGTTYNAMEFNAMHPELAPNFVVSVDTTGIVQHTAKDVTENAIEAKYYITYKLDTQSEYTVSKTFKFKVTKSSLTAEIKNEYTASDGNIEYVKVKGSSLSAYNDAVTVKSADGTVLTYNTDYVLEVSDIPDNPYITSKSGDTYSLTVKPKDSGNYTGSAQFRIVVSDPGLKYTAKSGESWTNPSSAPACVEKVTLAPVSSDYTISLGSDGANYSASADYTSVVTNKTIEVYYKYTTGKVVRTSAPVTVLKPVLTVDGAPYTGKLSKKFYDYVNITAADFTITAISDDSLDNVKNNVYKRTKLGSDQSFTVTLKVSDSVSGDKDTKTQYTFKIEGLTIVKGSAIPLKIAGKENNLKEWYNVDPVTVAPVDTGKYQIKLSGDNTFSNQINVTGEGINVTAVKYKNLTDSKETDDTLTIGIDTQAPTGQISVGAYSSNEFKTADEMATYVTEEKAITITASDPDKAGTTNKHSGVDYINYLISDTFYSTAAKIPTSAKWMLYSVTDKPTIDINKKNYIYAKIVDKAGNETYLSTGYIQCDLDGNSGSIKVDDYISRKFQRTDEFGAYANSSSKVTMTGKNSVVGIQSIEYYVSDSFLSAPDDVEAAILEKSSKWRTYSDSFAPSLIKDKNNYIYGKITDNSGNVNYISTAAILYDTISPQIVSNEITKVGTVSDYRIALNATDNLSGVESFRVMYKVKNSSTVAPSKDELVKSGMQIAVSDVINGIAQGSGKVFGLDDTKNYAFYLAAIDKSGNVSDIVTVGVNGSKGGSKGVITVDDYATSIFQSIDTVALCANTAKKATITASDTSFGLKKIEYYVSDTFYGNPSEVVAGIKSKSSDWSEYSANFQPTTVKDKKNYIYARIVDNNDNYTYLSTGAIIYDTVAPKMQAQTATKGDKEKEYKIVVGAKDELSGVNRFKLMIKEKPSDKDKVDAPNKDDIFNNGIYIATSKEENLISGATYTVTDIDPAKNYVFFFAAVDRAGNVSDVTSVDVSGSGASGSGSGTGANSNAAGNKAGGLTPAPNGIAGSGTPAKGSSGGTKKGTGTADTKKNPLGDKDREISRDPYIADATGNIKIGQNATGGWDKITAEVKKADKGSVIEVEMSGTSEVPKSLFDALKGKEVSVKLRMANDVEWEIKGDKLKDGDFSDVDMGVKVGSRGIPDKLITEVADTYPHVEFSTNATGDLGFEASITIPVDKLNAGMNATLYRYDAESKELKAVGTVKVDANGNVTLPISEGGDYTIIISPDRLLASTETTGVSGLLDNSGNVTSSPSQIQFTDIFTKRGGTAAWLFIMALISAVLCLAILFAPNLQIKKDDEFSNLM